MLKPSNNVLMAHLKIFLGAANYSLSLISTLWSCTDNGSFSQGQIQYINKINQNKCGHCVVFEPEVITSQGDISIHAYPGGASQITISRPATNKEPTQIHSCTCTQMGDLAPCSHNVHHPRVSNLIST